TQKPINNTGVRKSMLQFFRKYQKIFFFVVTFFVVVSFCFFGTFGTLSQGEKTVDTPLSLGVAGKAIGKREFQLLCQLLESSAFDRSSKEATPNFLNPGIIERDFLSTGLATLLVKPYFSELKPDLDARMGKMRKAKLYAHPSEK